MIRALLLTLVLGVAAPAAAQHNFTPADLERGARIYQSTCVTCHGVNGDQVAGTALKSGRFRRGGTDDEIARLIINGIPGTAMPPHRLAGDEAAMIVAWLRSSTGGRTVLGSTDRGKILFETKGQCRTCHDATARFAPALTDIGSVRDAGHIEESIVDPSAELHQDYRFVTAVTKAGERISGRLLNQSSFSIQLLDTAGHLRSLDKADLRSHDIDRSSPMPPAAGRLSVQEVNDLVAYLSTLGRAR